MSRRVWAVVPAKAPSRGKSRLRGALDDEARARFARELLAHVLSVLRASELAGVLVATDSDEVEAIARAHGASVVRDGLARGGAALGDRIAGEAASSRGGGAAVADAIAAGEASVARGGAAPVLARIVDAALADVAARGADAAIVLMADLPRITAADVRALIAALDAHDVVAVPDHLGLHTNALALVPPRAIATCFGRPDSFAAHEAAARERGLRFGEHTCARIAFDVDDPADLARLSRLG